MNTLALIYFKNLLRSFSLKQSPIPLAIGEISGSLQTMDSILLIWGLKISGSSI